MDKLKKYIDENMEDFNDFELPEGHLERFDAKLKKTSSKRISLYWISGAVAAVAMMILIISGLKEQPDDQSSVVAETESKCSEIQEEINQLTFYYNMKVCDLLSKIEDVCVKSNSNEAKEILESSKTVHNDVMDFENNIVPDLPCSDLSFEIITRQYDANIASLQLILDQAQRI